MKMEKKIKKKFYTIKAVNQSKLRLNYGSFESKPEALSYARLLIDTFDWFYSCNIIQTNHFDYSNFKLKEMIINELIKKDNENIKIQKFVLPELIKKKSRENKKETLRFFIFISLFSFLIMGGASIIFEKPVILLGYFIGLLITFSFLKSIGEI